MKWVVRLAIAYLVLLLTIAIAAPFLVPVRITGDSATRPRSLYPHSPYQVNLERALSPPSPAHPAGTDALGRDLLARLIVGTRSSMLVSLVATFVSLLIGIPLGALAGYRGGWFEAVFRRFIELFFALPVFFLLVGIQNL